MMRASLWLFAGLIAVVGCSDQNSLPMTMERSDPGALNEAAKVAERQARDEAGQAGGGEVADAAARKILYTAHLEVIVEDFDVASAALTEFVRTQGGYFSRAEFTGHTGAQRTGDWTIRVPVEQFDALREHVVALGVPQRDSLDSQDVTEEFIDVQARIKNKRTQEERLNELMQNAGEKVEDILALEQEITRVRGEIEQAEGRHNVLTRLTAMATAHVRLVEIKDYVPLSAPSYGETLSGTFSESVEALENFGTSILLFLVALVPWLPLIGVVGVAAWVVQRKRRHRIETTLR